MRKTQLFLILLLPFLTILVEPHRLSSQTPSQSEEKKIEPLSKWSKQWLEEIVPYIITGGEKEYFINLPTETERGQYILHFWKVRDPDPSTPENEFKLEHYRRIAAANRLFGASDIAGWRTIRGKVYILLGPPHEIETDTKPNPAGVGTTENKDIGSRYNVKPGDVYHGSTETWGYYGISKRLPYFIQFVFVDKLGAGKYELARTEKSANIPGRKTVDLSSALTEKLNIRDMSDVHDQLQYQAEVLKNPFEREDLMKGIVTTQVAYEYIPLDYDVFHLKGTEKKTYSILSLEIPFAALSSKHKDGRHYFSLSAVMNVRNKEGEIVFDGSREINYHRTDDEYEALKDKVYNLQVPMVFEPSLYTINLVVLDNYSAKVGTLEKEILLPSFTTEELMMSNIFLTSGEEKESAAQDATPYMNISEMKKVYHSGEEMTVYFEVYNLSLNPETGLCDFTTEYQFFHKGKLLAKVPAPMQILKDQKEYQVNTSFKLKNFKPGEYTLRVKAADLNAGKTESKETTFIVTD